MRLWSIHPRYLDSKGLCALWREGLLAQAVLRGKTKGYTRHPQLRRFDLGLLSAYLHFVCNEADSRGFAFSRDRILCKPHVKAKVEVSDGQLSWEFRWLLKKLHKRARLEFWRVKLRSFDGCNPIFTVVQGPPESWEKGIGAHK